MVAWLDIKSSIHRIKYGGAVTCDLLVEDAEDEALDEDADDPQQQQEAQQHLHTSKTLHSHGLTLLHPC